MASLNISEADIFDDSAEDLSAMSTEDLTRGSRVIDQEIRVLKVRPPFATAEQLDFKKHLGFSTSFSLRSFITSF
jgi:hypothetical protein